MSPYYAHVNVAHTWSSLTLQFGYNYSAFLSPALFFAAAVAWWFLDIYKPNRDAMLNEKIEYEGKRASPTASIELMPIDRSHTSLLDGWKKAVHGFFKACYYGAWMCLRHRKFVWLIPSTCPAPLPADRLFADVLLGYTFALYGHRYLEYGVVQIYAKSVLGNSGLAQVIVGGYVLRSAAH